MEAHFTDIMRSYGSTAVFQQVNKVIGKITLQLRKKDKGQMTNQTEDYYMGKSSLPL